MSTAGLEVWDMSGDVSRSVMCVADVISSDGDSVRKIVLSEAVVV